MNRWTDRQLWAAVVAAPVAWTVLYFALESEPSLFWARERPLLFVKWVLVFPVLEELVFRGLVQDAIARVTQRRRKGLSAANLLTSLLFSASHVFLHATLWAGGVLFPSLVFGYFRERHATLATPVALHVFYNAGFLLVLPGGI